MYIYERWIHVHTFELITVIVTRILPEADKIEILVNLNRSPLSIK